MDFRHLVGDFVDAAYTATCFDTKDEDLGLNTRGGVVCRFPEVETSSEVLSDRY